VEDKTFGLKNKNKSKVVQEKIKQVTCQVNQTGSEQKQLENYYEEKKRKEKLAEE